MVKPTLFNLFKAFSKIGLILLGGGYVIVPIMKEELILKRNWLSEDELLDFYCISQCLGGIIAINMSILVGCKLLKLKGAFVSVLSMALSPIISIVIIATIMNKIMSIPFMEAIFWGVNLSVIVLIYLALKDMWEKSMVDKFSYFWFFLILILAVIKISPVLLIIFSISLGLFIQKVKLRRDKKNV